MKASSAIPVTFDGNMLVCHKSCSQQKSIWIPSVFAGIAPGRVWRQTELLARLGLLLIMDLTTQHSGILILPFPHFLLCSRLVRVTHMQFSKCYQLCK